MFDKGSPQYKRITQSLAIGSFIIFCNLYLFQPILPHMAEHFQVSETQINWLFAATTLGLSISLVPWAIASETFGRKPIILFSLFAIPLIGLSMVFTTTLLQLVIARAFMGIAVAAFAGVAVAYMVEELSPKAFAVAIGGYIAANSLGGIFGRVLGGLITDYFDWHATVLFFVVGSLIGALYIAYSLPDQQNFKPQKGLFFHHNRSVVMHLRNRTLWLAMLIGGANFALFVNLYSVMGFRLVSAPHSVPVGLASLIFLCYLAGTVSSKLSNKWTLRFDPLNGILMGVCISLIGMLISAIDKVPFMLAGLLLISGGAFFAHTLAYSWVSQKAPSAKATATALYLVHYYIGGSLGGFLLLYCWQLFGWNGVIAGGSIFYVAIFAWVYQLKRLQVSASKLAQA
ncbi:MFS transporter [Vibrio splendidus]|uniref:MFS transporter n=1 Tax=Vibrio splendidus TaxID=29497 RepID=UPI0024682A8D|nr:MFS transporter [Vibrio splendidus]MDH5934068.1 MFS transporter [Vibrio splendidus]